MPCASAPRHFRNGGGRFGGLLDEIVAVGHSNADGIRVASDLFMPWASFAPMLKPLKPRRLLLVACQAGRANAGQVLFDGLREPRRIYTCPVNASKDFGATMMFAIPYVVPEHRPKDRHGAWSQAATLALTGRQLREWRRTTDKGNPDAAIHDLLAVAADPVARAVPQLLGSLIRR